MKYVIYFLCILPINIFAQIRTANDWYFGDNAGVKFEYGIPHGIIDGMISTGEGCSTVGDENGNLLFYTDGQTVYNRNHQPMPNGTNLLGNWSATTSSLIIPCPHSDSLFYIFTVDAIENHLQNGLRYNIVNMSLDSGLGDIIQNKKNILLESPVCEKLTAVLHQNLIFTWLIAHRWDSDEFIAYLVTDTGLVDTPVVSSVGSIHQGGYSSDTYLNGWTNAIGYMKSNITGTKIALAIHRQYKYELFDFNSLTGELSNCITSPTTYNDAYGVEFSPDGTKLYVTQTIASNIYQFDLSQPNPFNNVVHLASPTYQPSAIQVGPNGKLYVCERYNPYLSVINNPDALGLACDYQSQGVYLEGKNGRRGLPTIYYYKGFKYITGSEISDTICQGDSIEIYGTYYATTTEIHDTIHLSSWKDSIVNIYVTVNPIPSTPIISENSGVLTSTYSTAYQWYLNGNPIAGAIYQNYTPAQSGNYQVETFNSSGCSSISDIYNFVYIGFENINNNDNILIYPNPSSSGIFYLKGNYSFTIQVFNILGQPISNFSITKNKGTFILLLKNVPKGIYLLRIKKSQQFFYQKIILN